jgi:hypothetical protein
MGSLHERLVPAGSNCPKQWSPPQGVRTYEGEYELRVRDTGSGWVVEDVVLLMANVSDAALEECFRASYVGQHFEAQPPTGDTRARVSFPVHIYVQNPR